MWGVGQAYGYVPRPSETSCRWVTLPAMAGTGSVAPRPISTNSIIVSIFLQTCLSIGMQLIIKNLIKFYINFVKIIRNDSVNLCLLYIK